MNSIKKKSFNAYQWENHLYDQAAKEDDADILGCRNNALFQNVSSAVEAFQNVNTFSTYYSISLHLKSAGYNSILNVLSRQMRIEYQYTFTDYMQQNSHCSHNQLLQKIHHVQMKYIGNSLLQPSPWIFTLIKWGRFPLRLYAVGTVLLVGIAHIIFSWTRLSGFFQYSGAWQGTFPRFLPIITTRTLINQCNSDCIIG